MFVFLIKRINNFKTREIFDSFLKILTASVLMIISVCLILPITDSILSSETLRDEFLRMVIVGATGCLVYFGITLALNSPEIKIFKNLLLKKFSDRY